MLPLPPDAGAGFVCFAYGFKVLAHGSTIGLGGGIWGWFIVKRVAALLVIFLLLALMAERSLLTNPSKGWLVSITRVAD